MPDAVDQLVTAARAWRSWVGDAGGLHARERDLAAAIDGLTAPGRAGGRGSNPHTLPLSPAHGRPRQPGQGTAITLIEAVDWDRMRYLLAYALAHGGNLPPGALREVDRG